MADIRARRPSFLYPAFACLLITSALMLYPGDAPWGAASNPPGDDVALITAAIKSNQKHELITAGLGGSFGYPYGPIPSQIYQLLTLITHDLQTLVRLHAGLFAAVTAIGLLYLTQAVGVSPWLAPMTMLGPFFWFYTRLMWDNTFAIPVGTLLLAAYGNYLRRPSRSTYFISVSCAIALPLIHPMTLPLVGAVGLHAVFTQYRSVKKHWRGFIVIAICTLIIGGPYCKRVVLQMGHSAALIPPREDALTHIGGLLFPLKSGRLFSAEGFFDERGPEAGLERCRWASVLRGVSVISYPLIWIGLLISASCWLRKFQTPVPLDAPQPAPNILPALCLATLAFQSLMDGCLRISPYPHYYTGTWAGIVVLLWVGLDSLKAIKLRLPVALIYAVSMLISTLIFAIDIHTHHGGSIWYGPSLQSQINAHSLPDFP